jgi:glycosyltransferase involved in cell wall biosynthesis
MRVLLVSDSYPPLIGGATRAVHLLALGLRRQGNHVIVATSWQAATPACEDIEGIRVHRLDGSWSRLWRLLRKEAIRYRYTPPPVPDPEVVWRLRRLILSSKPDVIVSYGWLSYGVTIAMTGTRVPLILSGRDYANICAVRTLLRLGQPCTGPAWRKCLQCASESYGSSAKAAIAVGAVLGQRGLLKHRVSALQSCSGYVQEMIHSHLVGGRLSARLAADVVIPDYRTAARNSTSEDPRLPTRPFILFVGAFRRAKGIDVLVAAYDRLIDPPPLVLIGTPSLDFFPVLPESAVVLENLSPGEVMASWRRALFGVAPSVWPEPLGNVIHEGMSTGRPIVGTFPGGQNEMIVHDENGLLVPSGDVAALAAAMQRLIDDPALRRRLGDKAALDAERFTEARQLPRFAKLLDTVVKDHEARSQGPAETRGGGAAGSQAGEGDPQPARDTRRAFRMRKTAGMD